MRLQVGSFVLHRVRRGIGTWEFTSPVQFNAFIREHNWSGSGRVLTPSGLVEDNVPRGLIGCSRHPKRVSGSSLAADMPAS